MATYPVTPFLKIPLLPFDYGADGNPETWDIPANLGYTLIDTFAQSAIVQSPAASQTITQPGGTYFNVNAPMVFGAAPVIRFGVVAGVWDTSLSRTAAGVLSADTSAPGNGLGVITAAGFRINNAAPAGHILLGNGTNYVDSATIPVGAANYQIVQQAGTSITQRNRLNFLAPLTAVDNAGNNSSDVGLATSGVTAGSYVNANITVTANGIVTAISNGSGSQAGVIAVTGGSVPHNAVSENVYTIPFTIVPGQTVTWNASSNFTGTGCTLSVLAIGTQLYLFISNPGNVDATVPSFNLYYKII